MFRNLLRKQRRSAPYALAEVVQMAEEGRRLAIYDRTTQLYAYWYLDLRGAEEVVRARRYNKPLSVLSLWATSPAAIQKLTAHLDAQLRDTDIAGYLNNGHVVVILCETSLKGASVVLRRTLIENPGVAGATVTFPEDGSTFDDLVEAAKARIADRGRLAG
jgi:hypothetical protein